MPHRFTLAQAKEVIADVMSRPVQTVTRQTPTRASYYFNEENQAVTVGLWIDDQWPDSVDVRLTPADTKNWIENSKLSLVSQRVSADNR